MSMVERERMPGWKETRGGTLEEMGGHRGQGCARTIILLFSDLCQMLFENDGLLIKIVSKLAQDEG